MKRHTGDKYRAIRAGTASGTLMRRTRGASTALNRRRKKRLWAVIAAALALSMIVLFLCLRKVPPISPGGDVQPTETMDAPPPAPTQQAAPDATEAPAQPSLSVTDKESLIRLCRWMIQTGQETITLDAMTLSDDAMNACMEPWSNYVDAYGFTPSEMRFRLVFKPGVRVQQAYENGTTDALSEDDRSLLERALAVTEALITPDMSQLERELAIHDYICDHAAYSLIGEGEHTSDARGFFEYGLCQCAGYVDAFRLLARLAGLDVEMIGGPTARDTAGAKGHAWNLIRLDGLWYVVDVTWDDMLANGTSPEHTFFNLPVTAFGDSRSWDDAYSPEGTYATSVDAHYYYDREQYRAATAGEGLQTIRAQLASGQAAYVLFVGEASALDGLTDLMKSELSNVVWAELSEDLTISLYKVTAG